VIFMSILSISYGMEFDPPYLPVERKHFITQRTSLGTGIVTSDPVSYSNSSLKFPNSEKIMILPGKDAIIPIEMPPGDFDGFSIDVVYGKNFDIKWTLKEFDPEQGGWFSYYPPVYGTYSGYGNLTGKFETMIFGFQDLNPDYQGHGRHYDKSKLLGIHIKNNVDGILPFYILSYRTKMWVSTLEDAVR